MRNYKAATAKSNMTQEVRITVEYKRALGAVEEMKIEM